MSESIRKTPPDISFIIPVYNGAAYIGRCIESLLCQTVGTIEIIIINDGSTDETGNIIDQYAGRDPRIRCIHKENGGVALARNAGLDMARGDYIAFVDADDAVDPEFCEHMLWNIRKTKADIAECGRIDVLPDGENTAFIPRPTSKENVIDFRKKPRLALGSIFVWDKLFRRELIEQNHIRFPTGIRYSEDTVFLMECKLHCRLYSFVHRELYLYTAERENSATSSNKGILDIIKGQRKLVDLAFASGRYRELISDIGDVAAGFYVRRIFSFTTHDHSQMKEFCTEFIKFMEEYIPRWREKVVRYKSQGNQVRQFFNRYRLSLTGIRFFLLLSAIERRCSPAISRAASLWKRAAEARSSYRTIGLYNAFRMQPIQENAILFVSYFGSSVSDSMYYMLRDLQNSGMKIIIGTAYPQRDRLFCNLNGIEAELAQLYSKPYLKALARAKYLVLNSRFPDWFCKRENQVLLNTWHGTPLKTLGRRIHSGLSDVGNNQCQFLMSDWLLYPNVFTMQHMMRDFSLDKLYRGKVLLCGYPRNAVFCQQAATPEGNNDLKKKLHLEGKRIFIYMPTWRGETLDLKSVADYGKDLVHMLNKLDKHLPDDVVLFVKLHQVVMNKIHIDSYRHIRTVDQSIENYRFLSLADCLITDYSSVMFDFINMNRPILLFMYDYEEYMTTRGTYLDVNELTFDKAYTFDELLQYIKDFRPHSCVYEQERQRFCAYDNADTPHIANMAILKNQIDARAEVYDYAKPQEDPAYNLYLMPQLTSRAKRDVFRKIMKEDPLAVFIFAQDTFTKTTEAMLKEHNDHITYIITPIRQLHSLGEDICMKLSRVS
ncbi:MAG: CDP-glycerol glycerophosphotransferase family protein, partial [Desulfovibrionaceae bacterium]|nr:CDP-glycerol glycerophosphotransferase family protein [Desulfovibrionaceae bacterium]